MTAPPSAILLHPKPSQAMRLRQLFERQGLAVRCTDTVEATQAAAAAARPDLVVAEARPLGLSAEALAWRLRRDARLATVPLVILIEGSGSASGGDGAVARWAPCRLASRADPDRLVAEAWALLGPHGPQGDFPRRDPDDAFKAARLLMVDDSLTYREYVRLELEDEGATVAGFASAGDALDALDRAPFDGVIIDLIMPGMDGRQLCRRFDALRRQRGQFFTIVVLSSRETPEDLAACLAAGADEFIGKSLDMAVFKARLKALLRHQFLVEDTASRRAAGP